MKGKRKPMGVSAPFHGYKCPDTDPEWNPKSPSLTWHRPGDDFGASLLTCDLKKVPTLFWAQNSPLLCPLPSSSLNVQFSDCPEANHPMLGLSGWLV